MTYPWSASDKLLATDLNAIVKFGGTGTDGALDVTGGDTDIDASSVIYVVKNYTSGNIDITRSLTLSNPGTSYGTLLHLKFTGDVTINGTINLAEDGASGGARPTADVANQGGGSGNFGAGFLGMSGGINKTVATATARENRLNWNYHSGGSGGTGIAGGSGAGGGGGGGYVDGTIGTDGSGATEAGDYGGAFGKGQYGVTGGLMDLTLCNRVIPAMAGGGGGGGANAPTNGQGGIGGKGGGGLIIEVYGNLTFGASSVINLAGEAGGAATTTGAGGGGGGGGIGVILYNGTITDGGVTKTVTAGSAGGPRGGAGGAGRIIILKNTWFA